MSVRKKLENKTKFQFDENDIPSLAPRRPLESRKSVQSRLFKKAETSASSRPGPSSSLAMSGSGTQLWNPFAGSVTLPEMKISKNPSPAKPYNHRLQIKSPETNALGGLNVNSNGKSSDVRANLQRNDPVVSNVVAKLKAQYKKDQNSVTSPPSAGDPGDVSEAGVEVGDCACARPVRLVLCSLCGHTEAGRVSVKCGLHPRAVFLQDMVTCSACKRGGVTFLKEFDLPKGMEEALGGIEEEVEQRTR